MDETLDKTLGRPDDDLPNWSRRQFLLGTTGLAVAGAAALWARTPIVDAARGIFGSPVDNGLVHVYQEDFYFVPNYMTWRVGDKMTMRLHNMSLTRYHEMQLGRHVSHEKTIFGTLTADGFTEDFWAGVPVTFSNPYKIDNLVYNKAIPTFIGPKSDYALTSGGGFSPTLKPGGHIDITFVVPDKPGVWQYGCFVQYAAHWRLGMRGVLNVIKA
ncbi:MAG: cupredoxin domain-containing protein [Sulfobacillus sp.]